MTTVITDKTDAQSIEEILSKFNGDQQVDIYSSKMSWIERAIVVNGLKINDVVIQKENDLTLFILNNGTIIQRALTEIMGTVDIPDEVIYDFENVGDGVLWHSAPSADVSLKRLIQEELQRRYNLQITR